MDYGVNSMSAPLRRVLMREPGAILAADPHRWHYTQPLDTAALTAQYNTFVDLVRASGVEIDFLANDPADDLADSIFTYDASMVVPAGAVILRAGKALRRGEAELHQQYYDGRMPVLGTIAAPGIIEGGDIFWLDDATLAVGRGFRTNQAGIDQFRALVEPTGIAVEVYDLPVLHGREACLHLLSLISPLDRDLALIYEPLVPVALYERLHDLGYTLVSAPADEFEQSMGLNLNVLAVGPRRCIAVDGFPKTVALMRAAGCAVEVFDASELCIPCEGGPTCLTRPVHRSI